MYLRIFRVFTPLGAVRWLHQKVSYNDRLTRLPARIAACLPEAGSVLDVGAGNGRLAQAVMQLKPGLAITGIDVLVPERTSIAVQAFDGARIPAADKSVDFVLFVDCLHHIADPGFFALLQEAARVARKGIVVKDHNCNSFYTRCLISTTDYLANRFYGVCVPFNYKSRAQWQEYYARLGWEEAEYKVDLRIYRGAVQAVLAHVDFISVLRPGA